LAGQPERVGKAFDACGLTPVVGKAVAHCIYLHVSILDELNPELSSLVGDAERLAGLTRGEGYNVVRLDVDGPALGLLHYPDFFDDPFPALAAS